MNNQSGHKTRLFSNYKKMLVNEFRGYNGALLIKDILAGMTVGAVALPLALAFGAASVDAANALIGIAAGLITAIISGIVTGMLGGGSFQISGPTGAMTVVLTGIVAGRHGLTGMFLASFIAGAIILIAGLLRLGKLVQFIPRPVVTGFTSGIAVIIALGQLGNFFGIPLSGSGTIGKTASFFKSLPGQINYAALICSLAVVLIMVLYPKKLAKFVPGSLVSIIAVTVCSAVLKPDIAVIGSIPTSIVNSVHLSFGDITPAMIGDVSGAAVTIALLCMVESLLCGTCAANMKKESFDSNAELIAQGVGNMVVPFFGGVPSTAAIARTSVAITSGGRTRLTSLFQSLFLVACMFAFSGAIGYVPYAALAGVLTVTAFRMNEWKIIGYYFKNKLWDAVAMYFITMIATVFLDLTYAILIGVSFSVIMLISKLTSMDIEASPVGDKKASDALALYATGALFFANADEIPKFIEGLDTKYGHYIISMRGIIYIDVTAVDSLTRMAEAIIKSGSTISFTGVSPSVLRVLGKTGFTALVGEKNFYTSMDKALTEELKA